MIKFFRKIRQRMLANNKLSKYFIYATGEIVLVVIGILIALSINNWNEKRKNQNLGTTYLLEMLKEVQSDFNNVTSQINRLEKNIDIQEAALRTKNLETLRIDSLKRIIQNINTDFNFKHSTFNKMNNLGLTKLSSNKFLNELITGYYNVTVPGLNLYKEYIINYMYKDIDFMRYNQNKVDYTSNFSNIEFPILYKNELEIEQKLQRKNIIDFIQSTQGRVFALTILGRKKTTRKRLTDFQEICAVLLKTIHQELKNINPHLDVTITIPDKFNTTEIELSAAKLKKYVGFYKHSKDISFTITLEKSQLYGQPLGQPKFPLTASSEYEFVLQNTTVKIEFTIENDKVTSLTTYFGKKEIIANKIE